MKKLIFSFAILMSVVAVNAQQIAGKWNGTLDVHGRNMKVTFNISKSAQGYVSILNSPDQQIYNLESSYTTLNDSVLVIQIANAGIEYIGTMNKDGQFIGVVKQMGELFPMLLTNEKTDKKNIATNKKKLEEISVLFKPGKIDIL